MRIYRPVKPWRIVALALLAAACSSRGPQADVSPAADSPAVAAVRPAPDRPLVQAEGPLSRLYRLEYRSQRVAEWGPSGLTSLGEGRIELAVNLTDGGCIEKETVEITSVKTVSDRTVIDVVYAIDGEPCKAFFEREMRAALQLPKPGLYRIRLFVQEKYFGRDEVLRWERDVTY